MCPISIFLNLGLATAPIWPFSPSPHLLKTSIVTTVLNSMLREMLYGLTTSMDHRASNISMLDDALLIHNGKMIQHFHRSIMLSKILGEMLSRM